MGKRRKRNCSQLLHTGGLHKPVKKIKLSGDNADNQILHSDYVYEEPCYTYMHQHILPSVQELKRKDNISPHVKPLPKNGKYKNWYQYLSLQFNLLREDFIAPLRRGILNYKSNAPNKDITVYHQAKFTRMELKNDGMLLCVSFYNYAKQLSRKHLINGSLLCFSSDNFETILFATVANRKESSSDEGEILVKVESDIDCFVVLGINKDGWVLEQTEYTMVELAPHFETYDAVLKSLKSINPKTMPLTKYLIDCDYNRMPNPNYLRKNSVFNMKTLLATTTKHPCYFDVANSDRWPCSGDTDLNESQCMAVQQALTQEVSLVQGPPGTGKTHVGQKIIEILLSNMEQQGNSPILVVCYTNQALDQLLEKTVEFKEN